MGWRPWEPYQYKNSLNTLTGLDIDMVRAIMEISETPINFVEAPWKRHLKEVEAGRIDMAMGASKTKARDVWAYFSDPYRTESVALYVGKGKSEKWKFNHIKEIQNTNFNLCVTRGFYYGEAYETLIKKPSFKKHVGEVTTENQCYMMLKKGHIDGFLADPVGATTTLRKAKMLEDVEIILTVHSNDIHIMFSKQSVSRQFVNTFNQSLAKLKSRGKYYDILERYLSLNQSEKPAKKQTAAVTQKMQAPVTPPIDSLELSKANMAFNAIRLTKNLKLGQVGEEVGHLKNVLKILGYYNGQINNFFTSDFTGAVRKLQQDSNLIPDGIFGPLTYRALGRRL